MSFDGAFEETEWGLVHKAVRPGPRSGTHNYREHHLLMPGISVGGSEQRYLTGSAGTPPTSARWSVPIDDTHTMMVRSAYKPADNPGQFKEGHLPAGWNPIARKRPQSREFRQSARNVAAIARSCSKPSSSPFGFSAPK